ncbi:MAG: hypothetical protein WCH57_01585 [Verrucomicrobiota bacterium]
MGAIHFSIDSSLVRILQEALPIKNFVETGTFQGDTIANLLPLFESIHSVELSAEYHGAAVERFAGCTNVHLHLGASRDALGTIMENLGGCPTLFWLDAHWCAASHTAGEISQCPLLEELRVIGRLHPNSVIMIDDARYFLCSPPQPHEVSDWPAFQEILDTLMALGGQTHRIAVLDDVILFYPRRIHPQITDFSNRCGADWLQIASKARTFDQMVATYNVDWSQASAKAAGYDAAVARVKTLERELATSRKALEESRKLKSLLCAIKERILRFLSRSVKGRPGG